MPTLRVYRVQGIGPRKLRVYQVAGTGTNGSPKLRIFGVAGSGSAPITLRPFADQTVDAYAPVTLTALVGATSPTPDSYSWRQVSGPTVSFADNGESITFTAPPAWAGAVVVFGVTGYLNGSPSTEVTATTNVTSHLYWYADTDGVWKPEALPVPL